MLFVVMIAFDESVCCIPCCLRNWSIYCVGGSSFIIKCVKSCREATSMIVKKPIYLSLLCPTVIFFCSDDVQMSSKLDRTLKKARYMWYTCPRIKKPSSFYLLPLCFIILSFSQNGHLKKWCACWKLWYYLSTLLCFIHCTWGSMS